MFRILCVATIASVSLSACTPDSFRRSVGVKKEAPDEFLVLSRPPLIAPPTFDLPEPKTASEQFDRNKIRDGAKQSLTGNNAPTKETNITVSTGESSLLKRAGAAQADPAIRDKLNEDYAKREAAEKAEDKELLGLKGLLKPILPNLKKDKQDAAEVLDPAVEEQRLRDEQQQLQDNVRKPEGNIAIQAQQPTQ